jgi:hypothetical protein
VVLRAFLTRACSECSFDDPADQLVGFLRRLSRTDSISPAPRPPGQLVCGSTAAGSYSIERGGQQEQDARDENRAAGQRDTKDSEHSASNQEQDPPAGPHGASEPHHLAGAGRRIRADVGRRVTDVIEHPSPLLRVGSHQSLLGAYLLPACRITVIRYQPARGFLPRVQPPGHAARQTRVAARLRDVEQACRTANDRDVVVMWAELARALCPEEHANDKNRAGVERHCGRFVADSAS